MFVINLRLRNRQTGELATDFTEPVVVSLQPDIHEIKAAMTNCVQKLVEASRGFPRPEQNMGQIFGGKPPSICSFTANSDASSKCSNTSDEGSVLAF